MNHISKTQNRVMLVTVALILTFAAVMIVLTLTQNRRTEKQPEPQTAGSESTAHTETAPADKPHVFPESGTSTALPEKTESAAVSENDAAPVNAEEQLPDFISPVTGAVSKGHSVDVPVFSVTMNDYRTHTGVDIAAESGAPVRAVADGIVKEIWEDPMMGCCLSLEHSGGAVSIYKNLAPQIPENMTAGTAVRAGDTVGSVGESAMIELAESSHLHYELQIDGASVDPADFMLIGSEDTAYEG